MCLSYVDEKPIKHQYGYKIFKYEYQYFTNIYQYNSTKYKLGETYIAEQEAFYSKLTEYNVNGRSYLAGFHYYRYFKNAMKLRKIGQVVVKIKVSKILATGINEDVAVGVSNIIKLEKIMDTKDNKDKRKATENLLKKGILSKILKASKEYLETQNKSIFDNLKQLIIKNDENLSQYISFVDIFPRTSIIFKTMAKLHTNSLEEQDKLYLKRYFDVVHGNVDFKNDVTSSIEEFYKNYGEIDILL